MNPRKSVKLKLIASFMAVTAFVIISTMLDFYIFIFFQNTLDDITTKRLPPLILAKNLATQSERIVASAPSLIASIDEDERKIIYAQINLEIEKLSQSVKELSQFPINHDVINEIEFNFKTFINHINKIDRIVRKKLLLMTEEQTRYSQLLKIYKESEDIINPAISVFKSPFDDWLDSYFNGSYNSAELMPQTVQQLISLVEIRIKTSSLTNLLLSIATELDTSQLDINHLKCRSHFADIREQSELLIPELAKAYKELIVKFEAYSEPPNSLHELRRDVIKTISEGGKVSHESRHLSEKLNNAVQKLVSDTKENVNKSTKKVQETQKFVSIILIAVVILSLIVSGAVVWVYVERQVIRPIQALAKTAKEIESGNLDQKVEVQNDDEIGNLAQAFNSMVTKRNDAELSLRKAHEELEQRVEERTLELAMNNAQLNQEIIDHKASEEKRKKLEAELRQSRKMEAIGTLSGGIAHEFNNLLAIILGHAELLIDDIEDNTSSRGFAKEIINASLRGKEIVKQLLTFSRPAEQNHQVIDLSATARKAVDFLRASIPSTIQFKVDIPLNTMTEISSQRCLISGDETQIHQIIINLANNAYHAMEENGGTLEIAVERVTFNQPEHIFDNVLPPGDYIYLQIKDNGEGISPENIDRIFDPFYTTKSVGKGTGMGLAVVHGLMKGHGGGIKITSNKAEGTVAQCYFPALRIIDQRSEDESSNGSNADDNISAMLKTKEHILYVDDETMIVKIGKMRLERLGYQVTDTTNPLEALEIFRQNPEGFDLVITDMSMPQMSGKKLISMLKEIRDSVKIIVCSGYDEKVMNEQSTDTSASTSEKMGASGFLLKPHTMAELSSSVRKVLDGIYCG
ncbi:MAG: response regulator [Desulfamplus sp.]|nr:response regulator [Desulfamplus sp.]